MQHHSSLETYPLFHFFFISVSSLRPCREDEERHDFFSRSSSEKVEGNIYSNLFPLLADPLMLILFIFLQSHRLPTKVSSVTHWVITDNMCSRFHLYCRFVNNKYTNERCLFCHYRGRKKKYWVSSPVGGIEYVFSRAEFTCNPLSG